MLTSFSFWLVLCCGPNEVAEMLHIRNKIRGILFWGQPATLLQRFFLYIFFCWSKKFAGRRILRLAATNQHAKKQMEKQNASHALKTMTENM